MIILLESYKSRPTNENDARDSAAGFYLSVSNRAPDTMLSLQENRTHATRPYR